MDRMGSLGHASEIGDAAVVCPNEQFQQHSFTICHSQGLGLVEVIYNCLKVKFFECLNFEQKKLNLLTLSPTGGGGFHPPYRIFLITPNFT